jgi:hypothetical protein
LDVEEREVSAARFLEGSLICALQAVCRDLAALGSESAAVRVSSSAEAMSAILGLSEVALGTEGIVVTCVDWRLGGL